MYKTLTFLLMICIGCTAQTTSNSNVHILGGTKIKVIAHNGDENSNILFFNMHENETTSIEALKSYSDDFAINFIYLMHDGERRISFIEAGKKHSIDPNRIFTQKGRKATLETGGNYSKKAESLVAEFSDFLLMKIDKSEFIIAMHNNTPDEYSINSYRSEGSEAQNTEKLYINPEMDPDDFIYTTDEGIYQQLVNQKINVILQDNKNFVDDGSLSVYCGQNNIKYVNIETQEGHLAAQIRLMELILSIAE